MCYADAHPRDAYCYCRTSRLPVTRNVPRAPRTSQDPRNAYGVMRVVAVDEGRKNALGERPMGSH